MVTYSLHEPTRRNVIVWLLIAALVLVNGASFVSMRYFEFDFGSKQFGIHWQSLTVFTVLFLIFNRYIWRLRLIRYYLNVPDLNGIWVGTIERKEYPSLATETGVPVTVTIRQSFTSMAFSLENRVGTSMSQVTRSNSDNISIDGTGEAGFTLRESFHTGMFFGTTVWDLNEDVNGRSMTGRYVSAFPRTGKLHVRQVPNGHMYETGRVQRMISETGENYLGVAISAEHGAAYLAKLKKKRSSTQVGTWSRNQVKRDRGGYHLTVISPPEFKGLADADVEEVENAAVDFVLGDIGGVEMASSRTYYVIVSSPHIAFLRERAGLPHRDLHVTLAFDPADIHDVPKGVSTKLA